MTKVLKMGFKFKKCVIVIFKYRNIITNNFSLLFIIVIVIAEDITIFPDFAE